MAVNIFESSKRSYFHCDGKFATFLLPLILFFSSLSLSQIVLSPELLEQKISQKLMSVEQFKFIRETAEKMGIRVWLFGGTAAGYAYYAKLDALREQNDQRYQSERFDYEFTNIYRSTQDLDIVADGTLKQIDELAEKLVSRFPHFLGDKMKWEVRSLRFARGQPGELGYKEALLNDYDFLNQNSDSNSTGMVEITRHDEPVVRDLRDWDARQCIFFKDVLNGRVHFYHSSLHNTTSRARAGDNPEIFAVIRALTKAFQYEAKFTKKDENKIRKIIKEFDPDSIANESARRRLIEMGKKLFKHSVNIEYAWNTLEDMGLRQKLMYFDSASKEDSLAWWMNKEPLRSFKVGTGKGDTAERLGIDIVAHEANTFFGYESITRAHTGDPNFLISREGFPGEAAVHGDGTYTKIGREGARNTGLTVRLKVDPKARLGTDFIVKGEYVIFKNKNAFRVIPESIDMPLVDYFELLAEGKAFPKSERALLEKFKHRWQKTSSTISRRDKNEITRIVKEKFARSASGGEMAIDPLFEDFFLNPVSLESADLLEAYITKTQFFLNSGRPIAAILSSRHWSKHPQWPSLMSKVSAGEVIQEIFKQPQIFSSERGLDAIEKYIENPKQISQIIVLISLAHSEIALQHPKFPIWIHKLISDPTWDMNFVLQYKADILESVLLKSSLLRSDLWMAVFHELVKRGKGNYKQAIFEVLLTEDAVNLPQWKEAFIFALDNIDSRYGDPLLLRLIYSSPTLPAWPQIVDNLLSRGFYFAPLFFEKDKENVLHLFHHPDWPKHLQNILEKPTLLLESYLEQIIEITMVSQQVLSHPNWLNFMKLIFNIHPRESGVTQFLKVMSRTEVYQHPQFPELVEFILTHPEVRPLFKKHTFGPTKYEFTRFFSVARNTSHPKFFPLTGGKATSPETLLAAFEKGFTFTPKASLQQCNSLFEMLRAQ